MNTEDVVKIGKALSERNRVEILKLLSDDEICACELLEFFDITQPTLSHHMKILKESKLINVRKEGVWSYYTINKEIVDDFKEFLDSDKSSNQLKSNLKCKCDN